MKKFLFLALYLFSISINAAEKCEHKIDDNRIVHIKATTDENFWRCFGYFHGLDRAWQLDYFRRNIYGTNAEVYGISWIKQDITMRLLDLPFWANQIWLNLDNETKKILKIYVNGINEGLTEAQLPKNKKGELLDYPEITPWYEVDTIATILLQSFDQTKKTFSTEMNEEFTKKFFGNEIENFEFDKLPWNTTILKEGEYTKRIGPKVIPPSTSFHEQKLKDFFGPSLETGSNNWAISPKLSKDKVAMFASDPHLGLNTPMFWYWLHLKQDEKVNVIGGSFPGIPMITTGTNQFVSFGPTNSYYNTANLYTISKANVETIKTRPIIKFKFGPFTLPFFFKSIEHTKLEHYPIIPFENGENSKTILNWTGFLANANSVTNLLKLNFSKSVMEYDETLKNIDFPSWNFVYADTKGNIGHRVTGPLIKSTNTPRVGVERITNSNQAKLEILAKEDVPHRLNPKSNMIVTANNIHLPDDAHFNGGRSYTQAFRAKRIEDLILKSPLHDLLSFKDIHCDRYATDAEYFVPLFIQLLKPKLSTLSPTEVKVFDELSKWNFIADTECTACGVYRYTMDHLMEEFKIKEGTLWHLLPKNQLVQNKFFEFYRKASKEIGTKKWGQILVIPFAHLSKNEDWVFSPTLYSIGDEHTVGPATTKWNDDKRKFIHTAGPSQRMVVLMKPIGPEVYLVQPGLNRDYTNKTSDTPWKDWRECRYHQVNFAE